ncbi:ribbon-helix-helix domain-containing protein [Mesorhizobium sp. Root172]|uniref:ribbon-helix-helix domain-containing protein n=2 Tax=Phyllobacteriaceae TaxID=69277 RepID=UPI002A4E173A|nr:ribbon-helix-helix domain-containing protein [Mesorhizobium sp. Root172]
MFVHRPGSASRLKLVRLIVPWFENDIRSPVMGQVDKRSITLSPELAQAVDDVVAAGEYASASEVIRDALRQWKDRRDLLGYTVEELRKLVQGGSTADRVDSRPWMTSRPRRGGACVLTTQQESVAHCPERTRRRRSDCDLATYCRRQRDCSRSTTRPHRGTVAATGHLSLPRRAT